MNIIFDKKTGGRGEVGGKDTDLIRNLHTIQYLVLLQFLNQLLNLLPLALPISICHYLRQPAAFIRHLVRTLIPFNTCMSFHVYQLYWKPLPGSQLEEGEDVSN